MEDAHVTISDLGADFGGLSLFCVFDGHGGRQVALFCQEHFPDEVRRQLRSLRGAAAAPERPGGALGEALRSGFHALDDMLRSPEHERELLALKQNQPFRSSSSSSGSSGACSSATTAASSEADPDLSSEEDGEEKDGAQKQPEVLSFLQSSIQSDLAQARDRGALTREEATQVVMKMALMKRLKNQSPVANPSGNVADAVGCTAVCILLSEAEVVCANAGDSRAVMCRSGKPVELSHDHKPNDETERRRIEAAGGRVEETPVGPRVHYRVNGNLNLSRAIGDMEYKKKPELGPEWQMICSTPDLIAVSITQEDEFIVLACDGVWDVKSNQDVCDFVRPRLQGGEAIPAIVEALLDECMAKDPKQTHGLGGDNMTCIVVQLQNERAGDGAAA